jgi:PadR family transcriptional regulator PadR
LLRLLIFDPEGRRHCRPFLLPKRSSKFFLTTHTVYYIVFTVHYMTQGTETDTLLENLRLELRRGCLVVAVLAELRTEQYGYALRKGLSERGLEVDEGTLYPLLRRLEGQGLLVSEWREEDKRNKRFYKISRDGKLVLKQLLAEWHGIGQSLEEILKEPVHGTH